MIENAADLATASLSADVCVIGGGPAGLTVAAEAAAADLDVIVLEAGGAPYDRHDTRNLFKAAKDHLRGAQSLARGRTVGEPYYPLRLARARGLGGSTNALMSHGLRARPLDPIDLETRFGMGWPITHSELSSAMPAAEVYAGLRDAAAEAIDWTPGTLSVGGGETEQIAAAPFRHGTRERFPRLAVRLAGADVPRLVTSAVVTGFRVDGSASVRAADVVATAGSRFIVRAHAFVLAAGGIDNARLLLSSRPLLYAMDNAAEHVGRRFMEHLHYVAGYLVPSSPQAAEEIERLFVDPQHPAVWLTPSDQIIRKEGLRRVAYAAVPVRGDSLNPAVPAIGELARILPYGPYGLSGRLKQMAIGMRGAHHVVGAVANRARGRGWRVFALAVMSEQAPHPESRVVLQDRRDRTGCPLPLLRWRVGREDFADAERSTQILAEELGKLDVGRVVSLWDRGLDRPVVVTGGWHHMGTTAMSAEPSTGVVDADCRVHGISNLYVAGSSVFPTGGYANPTLTLVALAVRLGRHLAGHVV